MLVSVIMPVFNGERYLRESIECVLNQSFTDFELLILNDGSTDDSRNIVLSFFDKRIRLIDSPVNKGLVFQLNKGVELAEGKYIARFDADDICTPDRLEKQVHFLENNSDYGLCGSWMSYLGTDIICKFPKEHEEIVNAMLNENPIAHPVVMFRKAVLEKYGLSYEEEYWPAEDYKLWASMMYHTKMYNIPEPMLNYRAHEGQISQRKKELQSHKMIQVQLYQLYELLPGISEKDKTLLEDVFFWKIDYRIANLSVICSFFKMILDANQRIGVYDKRMLECKFSNMWYLLCKNSIPIVGFRSLKMYFQANSQLFSVIGCLKLLVLLARRF